MSDVIPIPIRSQMMVKVLLGVIDSNSTTYLFGDLSDDIPLPMGVLALELFLSMMVDIMVLSLLKCLL